MNVCVSLRLITKVSQIMSIAIVTGIAEVLGIEKAEVLFSDRVENTAAKIGMKLLCAK